MLTCNEMSPVLIPSSVEIPAPRSADQLMESFMVFPKNAKDLNKIDFIAKFISTHIISYGEFKILTHAGVILTISATYQFRGVFQNFINVRIPSEPILNLF